MSVYDATPLDATTGKWRAVSLGRLGPRIWVHLQTQLVVRVFSCKLYFAFILWRRVSSLASLLLSSLARLLARDYRERRHSRCKRALYCVAESGEPGRCQARLAPSSLARTRSLSFVSRSLVSCTVCSVRHHHRTGTSPGSQYQHGERERERESSPASDRDRSARPHPSWDSARQCFYFVWRSQESEMNGSLARSFFHLFSSHIDSRADRVGASSSSPSRTSSSSSLLGRKLFLFHQFFYMRFARAPIKS